MDIFVNNVGIIGVKGIVVEVDVVEWVKGLEINVMSMMLMVKYVILVMLWNEFGNGYIWGSIINMGLVVGL